MSIYSNGAYSSVYHYMRWNETPIHSSIHLVYTMAPEVWRYVSMLVVTSLEPRSPEPTDLGDHLGDHHETNSRSDDPRISRSQRSPDPRS